MSTECECGGCGVRASDWFILAGEEVPEWLGDKSVWYCSEECYEEGTGIGRE